MHRRTLTRTFPTGTSSRLRVENRDGSVNVRVHEKPEVTVLVTADIYADSGRDSDLELERIDRGISAEGDHVEVQVPDLIRPPLLFFGRGPRVDYEISVPAASAVTVGSRNGSVTIRGVRGPVEVENRNGSVAIEDVATTVQARSRNGKLMIARAAHSLAPSAARPGVVAETTNGALILADIGAAVTGRTSNGSLRFSGAIKGDVSLTCSNGGMRVSIPRESRFELDAESERGSLRSDLDVRPEPHATTTAAAAGPRHKVVLRSGNGSIRITPA